MGIRKYSRVDQMCFGAEPGGIRYCIRCGGEIEPGQAWLRLWAPNCEYCVGVHWACLPVKPTGRKMTECGLCASLLRADEIVGHFRITHRISEPVGALSLMR